MESTTKILVATFVIIGLCSLLMMGVLGSTNKILIPIKEERFCGTTSFTSPNLSENELKGKELYQANCGSCHHPVRQMTGPAFGNILKKREIGWITDWVQNQAKLIESGDTLAIKVANQLPTRCLSFPSLDEDDIANIMTYSQVQFNTSGKSIP